MMGHRLRPSNSERGLALSRRATTGVLRGHPSDENFEDMVSFHGSDKGSVAGVEDPFDRDVTGAYPLLHSRSEGAHSLRQISPTLNAELRERAARIKEAASDELNSVTATVMQLTNSMLGAGILAFPYHLAKVGVLVTLFTFGMLGVCMYFTMNLMLDCGIKRNIFDYALLVEDVLGRRMQLYLDLSIALCCMGNVMSYMNVIGEMGATVLREWSHHENIFVDTYAGFLIIFLLIVEFPFIFYKNFGDITWLSYFSLFLMSSVIIVFVGWEGQIESDKFHIPNWWPASISRVLGQLGTWSYAYAIQYATFEAYIAMTPEAKEKWPLTVKLCVGFGALLLLCMAFLGYAAFGQNCKSDIMSNFDSNKWEVQAGQMAVVVHLLANMPNDFVLMRLFFLRALNMDAGDLDWPRFSAVSIFLFAVPLFLMAVIPAGDVGGTFLLVINLTGDIPTAFACFVVPAVLWLKTFEGDRSWKFYLSIFIFCLGMFMMLVCSIHDIIVFSFKCSHHGCRGYGS